jgi:hypothetical protein
MKKRIVLFTVILTALQAASGFAQQQSASGGAVTASAVIARFEAKSGVSGAFAIADTVTGAVTEVYGERLATIRMSRASGGGGGNANV